MAACAGCKHGAATLCGIATGGEEWTFIAGLPVRTGIADPGGPGRLGWNRQVFMALAGAEYMDVLSHAPGAVVDSTTAAEIMAARAARQRYGDGVGSYGAGTGFSCAVVPEKFGGSGVSEHSTIWLVQHSTLCVWAKNSNVIVREQLG